MLAVTLVAGALEPLTILRAGLVVSGCGLALTWLAPTFAVMLVGLVLSSTGGAGIWITAPLLATEGVPPHRRGIVIGFLTGSIGFATSMVALGTRIARSSTDDPELWRPIYLVEALVTFAILGLVIAVVRARSTVRTRGGRISLDGLSQVPGWLPVTAAYVMFGTIAAGYSSFLAEALEEDGGVSRNGVANIYIGLGFSSLVGAPLMGWVSDRVGRRNALMTVMGLIGIVSITVALATGPLLIVVATALGGMWASYPTLTATYVRDHLDDRVFGTAYGTMTIFYGLAAVPAPIAAGALADRVGSFTISYLVFAAMSLVGLAALGRLPKT